MGLGCNTFHVRCKDLNMFFADVTHSVVVRPNAHWGQRGQELGETPLWDKKYQGSTGWRGGGWSSSTFMGFRRWRTSCSSLGSTNKTLEADERNVGEHEVSKSLWSHIERLMFWWWCHTSNRVEVPWLPQTDATHLTHCIAFKWWQWWPTVAPCNNLWVVHHI